jgi:RND family efflux transporter MFP subunit
MCPAAGCYENAPTLPNPLTQADKMIDTTPVRPLFLSSIAVILLLSLQAGCSRQEAEEATIRPVRAVTVGEIGGEQRRGFPGRAQATQEIDLAFRVGGPLIERPVNVGDEVVAGDLVARIDPRDYEVSLRNAKAQLADARAALARATSDFRRQRNIYEEDPGATSETAVDQAREARDRAAATVDSLSANVTTAQDQLADTYLKAPFDGTVVATYVENFQNVRQKERIVRILDTSRIEMVVNLPESLISKARKVRTVNLQFDAFPGREFEGQIKEIGTEADQTTRTFPVTLIMEQPEDITILPGMAGTARAGEMDLPDEERRRGLGVPVGAVFTPDTGTRSFVWVIEPTGDNLGVLKLRPVTTGELTAKGVLITDGLRTGELVVTAGVHSVREGQTVRIMLPNGA